MAGLRHVAFAQPRGPADDRRGPVAAGDPSLGDGMAVGFDHGSKTAGQHPVEDVERREGELQLQDLVPHLLLGAAQEDEILDVGAGSGEQPAPQQQHVVERARGVAGAAQHVAQHDQPVAVLPARLQGGRQPFQGGIVAGQAAQRPGGAAVTQAGDGRDRAVVHSGCKT